MHSAASIKQVRAPLALSTAEGLGAPVIRGVLGVLETLGALGIMTGVSWARAWCRVLGIPDPPPDTGLGGCLRASTASKRNQSSFTYTTMRVPRFFTSQWYTAFVFLIRKKIHMEFVSVRICTLHHVPTSASVVLSSFVACSSC